MGLRETVENLTRDELREVVNTIEDDEARQSDVKEIRREIEDADADTLQEVGEIEPVFFDLLFAVAPDNDWFDRFRERARTGTRDTDGDEEQAGVLETSDGTRYVFDPDAADVPKSELQSAVDTVHSAIQNNSQRGVEYFERAVEVLETGEQQPGFGVTDDILDTLTDNLQETLREQARANLERNSTDTGERDTGETGEGDAGTGDIDAETLGDAIGKALGEAAGGMGDSGVRGKSPPEPGERPDPDTVDTTKLGRMMGSVNKAETWVAAEQERLSRYEDLEPDDFWDEVGVSIWGIRGARQLTREEYLNPTSNE